MHARTSALAGGLLLALLVPASAQAVPTLEPLKPCYVTAGTAAKPTGEPVLLRAAGFTPESRVDLAVDGTPFARNLQVNAAGQLIVPEFPAPFVGKRKRERAFSVTLTEQGNVANTVTATASTAALQVTVRPRDTRPDKRVVFDGLGFTADRPVYAHYTFRGKQRARVRMARRSGDCGSWTVRRTQFPMDKLDAGVWIIQFDQSKKFYPAGSKRLKSVSVLIDVTIKRDPS